MIKVTIVSIEDEINQHGFFKTQEDADKYINKIAIKYSIKDIETKTTQEVLPDKSDKELNHKSMMLLAVKLKDGSAKLGDVINYLISRDNI